MRAWNHEDTGCFIIMVVVYWALLSNIYIQMLWIGGCNWWAWYFLLRHGYLCAVFFQGQLQFFLLHTPDAEKMGYPLGSLFVVRALCSWGIFFVLSVYQAKLFELYYYNAGLVVAVMFWQLHLLCCLLGRRVVLPQLFRMFRESNCRGVMLCLFVVFVVGTLSGPVRVVPRCYHSIKQSISLFNQKKTNYDRLR